MARREKPGIGEAGETGGLRLPVDDRDLMAITREFIGRGDADDPGPQHQRFHDSQAFFEPVRK